MPTLSPLRVSLSAGYNGNNVPSSCTGAGMPMGSARAQVMNCLIYAVDCLFAGYLLWYRPLEYAVQVLSAVIIYIYIYHIYTVCTAPWSTQCRCVVL